MSNDNIFLHIGYPKTATTLLQQNVFPKWSNMEYRNSIYYSHLVMIDDSKKYIISNENLTGCHIMSPSRHGDIKTWFDERKLIIKSLSKLFPEARLMVSFRKHSDYIVSLYKQYLHGGGVMSLEEYFDLDSNQGFMKREDFIFRNTLELLSEHFKKEPFVFCLEEIKSDFPSLLKRFEVLFGEKAPDISINAVAPVNVGVGHWQAKILRFLNSIDKYPDYYPNPKGIFMLKSPRKRAFGLDSTTICQYRLRFLSKRPLAFEPELKKRIDDFYLDDWNYIRQFALNSPKNLKNSN